MGKMSNNDNIYKNLNYVSLTIYILLAWFITFNYLIPQIVDFFDCNGQYFQIYGVILNFFGVKLLNISTMSTKWSKNLSDISVQGNLIT